MKKSHESLKSIVHKGDTLYTVLRHISRSGMQRCIDVYKIADNRPIYLSHLVADALDARRHKSGGIIVTKCGMDMGFDLVYRLSVTLFCPTKYNHDNAYSLQQKWL